VARQLLLAYLEPPSVYATIEALSWHGVLEYVTVRIDDNSGSYCSFR
jgi:hypothetical protein